MEDGEAAGVRLFKIHAEGSPSQIGEEVWKFECRRHSILPRIRRKKMRRMILIAVMLVDCDVEGKGQVRRKNSIFLGNPWFGDP